MLSIHMRHQIIRQFQRMRENFPIGAFREVSGIERGFAKKA
jgi:hypothetical protein